MSGFHYWGTALQLHECRWERSESAVREEITIQMHEWSKSNPQQFQAGLDHPKIQQHFISSTKFCWLLNRMTSIVAVLWVQTLTHTFQLQRHWTLPETPADNKSTRLLKKWEDKIVNYMKGHALDSAVIVEVYSYLIKSWKEVPTKSGSSNHPTYTHPAHCDQDQTHIWSQLQFRAVQVFLPALLLCNA